VPREADELAGAVIDVIRDALQPLTERVCTIERQFGELTHETTLTLTKELAAVRERLAVVETRAPVPGPPGADGVNGQDGLGFDDLAIDFDGNRMLTLRFTRGDQTKTFAIELPFLKWQGTYRGTTAYRPGDVVTWAGSAWHAKEATMEPPGDGSKTWTLMVKRGRDGRDGKDRAAALR
jgi:hypothetical protein